jgi:hypothetical protein
MGMHFSKHENYESRDIANHRMQPMLKSSNMVVNLCLQGLEVNPDIRLNMQLRMKSVAHEPSQDQDHTAARSNRSPISIQTLESQFELSLTSCRPCPPFGMKPSRAGIAVIDLANLEHC